MKTWTEIRADKRLYCVAIAQAGDGAKFIIKIRRVKLAIIASWGGGWDHVSVSTAHRCPAWEEMQEIKQIFWRPDECVIQYHPPEAEYVRNHPYCLHMWRPQQAEIPMPPRIFVGVKNDAEKRSDERAADAQPGAV